MRIFEKMDGFERRFERMCRVLRKSMRIFEKMDGFERRFERMCRI